MNEWGDFDEAIFWLSVLWSAYQDEQTQIEKEKARHGNR